MSGRREVVLGFCWTHVLKGMAFSSRISRVEPQGGFVLDSRFAIQASRVRVGFSLLGVSFDAPLLSGESSEEPEESAVVIVEVVDEAIGVPGAGWVCVQASCGVTTRRSSQQCRSPEDKERVVIHEVQNCKERGNGVLSCLLSCADIAGVAGLTTRGDFTEQPRNTAEIVVTSYGT